MHQGWILLTACLAAAPPVDRRGDPLPPGAIARLGTVRPGRSSFEGLALPPDGQLLPVIEGHWESVSCVAFLPDGKRIVSASRDGTIQVWEAKTGKPLKLIRDDQPIGALAVSANGKLLAAAGEAPRIRISSLDGSEKRDLPADSDGSITSLAFCGEDNAIVRTAANSRAVAINGTIGPPASEWFVVRADQKVTQVAVSPDKRLLAGASDCGRVRVWKIKGHEKEQDFETGSGHAVRRLSFSPDGFLLAAAGDRGFLTVWDIPARLPLFRRLGPSETHALAFSPDGSTLAAADKDGRVLLLDPATGAEKRRLEGHATKVLALAFSPDGRMLASAGSDTQVIVWNVKPAALDPPRSPEQLWKDLGGADAVRAYRALHALTRDPAGPALVARRLHELSRSLPGGVQQRITELDSKRFSLRRRASEELVCWGPFAEKELRIVLAGKPSLEVRRRVENILSAIEEDGCRGEALLVRRGTIILERSGTQGRRALKELARTKPATWVSHEARKALGLLLPE